MADGVSCLCLTYGRPEFLEEAVASFLKQNWTGPKELIVVNDYEGQTLVFNHPEVKIFNLPQRLQSLGEKRNRSVEFAKYDNFLIWDDDDIYLPWRIEETMKTLPTEQFYKCPHAWVMNDGKLDKDPHYNLFHSGSAYTRWLFDKAGKYDPALNGGEDSAIEWQFQIITPTKGEYWKHTYLSRDRLYYIYRWGHGSYHTTGVTSLQHINPVSPKGNIHLHPIWKMDYEQIVTEHIKNNPENG